MGASFRFLFERLADCVGRAGFCGGAVSGDSRERATERRRTLNKLSMSVIVGCDDVGKKRLSMLGGIELR